MEFDSNGEQAHGTLPHGRDASANIDLDETPNEPIGDFNQSIETPRGELPVTDFSRNPEAEDSNAVIPTNRPPDDTQQNLVENNSEIPGDLSTIDIGTEIPANIPVDVEGKSKGETGPAATPPAEQVDPLPAGPSPAEAPSEVPPEAPSEVVSEAPSEVVSEAPSEVSPEAPSEVVSEAPSSSLSLLSGGPSEAVVGDGTSRGQEEATDPLDSVQPMDTTVEDTKGESLEVETTSVSASVVNTEKEVPQVAVSELNNGEMPQIDPSELNNGEIPQLDPSELNNGEMPQVDPSELNNGDSSQSMGVIIMETTQSMGIGKSGDSTQSVGVDNNGDSSQSMGVDNNGETTQIMGIDNKTFLEENDKMDSISNDQDYGTEMKLNDQTGQFEIHIEMDPSKEQQTSGFLLANNTYFPDTTPDDIPSPSFLNPQEYPTSNLTVPSSATQLSEPSPIPHPSSVISSYPSVTPSISDLMSPQPTLPLYPNLPSVTTYSPLSYPPMPQNMPPTNSFLPILTTPVNVSNQPPPKNNAPSPVHNSPPKATASHILNQPIVPTHPLQDISVPMVQHDSQTTMLPTNTSPPQKTSNTPIVTPINPLAPHVPPLQPTLPLPPKPTAQAPPHQADSTTRNPAPTKTTTQSSQAQSTAKVTPAPARSLKTPSSASMRKVAAAAVAAAERKKSLVQKETAEEEVKSVNGKRYNKRTKREEWHAVWSDGSSTWEPKENFVDFEDGVEVANSHWKEFEEKEAARKLKEQSERKQRAKRATAKKNGYGSADESTEDSETPPQSPPTRKRKTIEADEESSEEAPAPKKTKKTTEKRLGRWRNNPSKLLKERINSLKSQKLFLIERKSSADATKYEFSVGSHGENVNHVIIGLKNICDCQDFVCGTLCKHILFVLIKVLKVRKEILHFQTAYVLSELNEIFSEAPDLLASCRYKLQTKRQELISQSQDNNNVVSYHNIIDPSIITYCSICHDDFTRGLVNNCKSCGLPIHVDCFEYWKNSTKKNQCIYCDSDIIPDPPLLTPPMNMTFPVPLVENYSLQQQYLPHSDLPKDANNYVSTYTLPSNPAYYPRPPYHWSYQ